MKLTEIDEYWLIWVSSLCVYVNTIKELVYRPYVVSSLWHGRGIERYLILTRPRVFYTAPFKDKHFDQSNPNKDLNWCFTSRVSLICQQHPAAWLSWPNASFTIHQLLSKQLVLHNNLSEKAACIWCFVLPAAVTSLSSLAGQHLQTLLVVLSAAEHL